MAIALATVNGQRVGEEPVIEETMKEEQPSVRPKDTDGRYRVGVFKPKAERMPTLQELTAVLSVLGLRTRRFEGADEFGNIVAADGSIVIPAHLRGFFDVLQLDDSNKNDPRNVL